MEQQHAIGKLLLEVRLPSRDEAFSLQGSLSTRCNEELAPMLSAVLDSWTDPDTLLQIDRLEIDLGSCNMDSLQKELPGLVIDYLRKNYQTMPGALPSSNGIEGVQRRPLTHGYFDTWLYFLKNGVLPAAAVKWQQDEWEAGILSALSSETFAVEKCRELFTEYPYAVRRLVLQFSRRFIRNWVLAYSGETYRQLLQLVDDWQELLFHTQLQEQLKELQTLLPAMIPASEKMPEKAIYLDRVYEWLINDVIINRREISSQALLDQLLQIVYAGSSERDVFATLLYILSTERTAIVKTSPAIQQAVVHLTAQYKEQITALQQQVATAYLQKAGSNRRTDKPAQDDNVKQAASGEDIVGNRTTNTVASSTQEDAAAQEVSSKVTNGEMREKHVKGEQRTDQESASATDKQFKETADPEKKKQSQLAAEDITTPVSPAEGSIYYINNAGLILLHPYLSFCFDALGLREGKAFKDEAASHKAVQLLGYLAHGEEDIPEYDLVLPKILCGIQPATPVRRFIPLTAAEKTEANELLAAVISHWNALGNTSPDGLRGNFLMREGKLEWREEEWQLYVTQQSYDMLLNSLPWGFSVVGLSWMPWLIKTVWT